MTTPPTTVTGNHYTMTVEDFPNGCLVSTDVLTGNRQATGRNRLGLRVTLPLDVPLCSGCDSPIQSTGICEDCGCIHLDIADTGLTECRGDPLLNARAA